MKRTKQNPKKTAKIVNANRKGKNKKKWEDPNIDEYEAKEWVFVDLAKGKERWP